jgi:Flp pilus assembly protein TadG
MKMSRRPPRRRSGIAIIEFTLSLTFLIPLLLGTFVFGFRLIRSLEMEQVVRDLGHMYVRDVNFRNSGPQQNAQTLAQGFDLTSAGTSLLVFSQIRICTQADCDTANPTKIGQACTNLGNPVFTEQLTLGNSSLVIAGKTAKSVFGAPPVQALSSPPASTDFKVSAVNLANNSNAAAGNTGSGTGFATVITLQVGEVAYMVEMFNATPELNIPGLSGSPQVYARSVF